MSKKDSRDKKQKAVALANILTPPPSTVVSPNPTPSLSPITAQTICSHSHERSSPVRDGGDSDTDEDEDDIARETQAAEEERVAENERQRELEHLQVEKKSRLFLSPIQTFSGFTSAFGGRKSPASSPGGSPILSSFPSDSLSSSTKLEGLPTPSASTLAPPPTNAFRPGPSLGLSSPLPSGLTPLQSLHLLSSQKLSLLVRPPPPGHPIFSSSSTTGASSRLSAPYTATDLGETTLGNDKRERRFPSSSNIVRRELEGGGGGMRAEMGVRGLMKRLEKGGRARREEVEALIESVSILESIHSLLILASNLADDRDLSLFLFCSFTVSSSGILLASRRVRLARFRLLLSRLDRSTPSPSRPFTSSMRHPRLSTLPGQASSHSWRVRRLLIALRSGMERLCAVSRAASSS